MHFAPPLPAPIWWMRVSKFFELFIMFCLFGGIGVIRMKQYECHEAKEKQKIWPTLLRMTWDIQVNWWSGPSPSPLLPNLFNEMVNGGTWDETV